MAGKKIGIVIGLDGEQKFTQGMKNAQQASKQLDSELRTLKTEFKDSANSMEYLSKKQELLKQKQEAYQRTLTAAKAGQSNAKKAYKEQAEALDKLEKEYQQASEALSKMAKDDPGFDKQAREVEKLSAALDKQTAYYLRAEGRLSSWDNKVNKAEGDIRRNNSALEKNASDMGKGASEADKFADSMDDVSKESKDAAGSIKEVGISLGSMVKAQAVDLAATAMKELGRAAIEAAKYAIEVGSNYEAAMSEVEAISGASGASLDKLSDKAKELGRSTKFSASEVASAYKYMGMAGWDAGEMLSGIDGIINLAAASGEELGTVSDIVTDDLTAFGMAASDAGRMADVLAAASTNSNTNVSLLGETFKYAGAVAGSFGYTLEDVSVAAGLMANAGIKGSQAGTALRSIFTRLATDAGASSTKLGALGTLTDKLGVQFYNADGSMRKFSDVLADTRKAWSGLTQEQQSNYANTIAGKNALSGFLSLMNAEQADFDKLTASINNSSGAAEKMATIMQDNLQGQVTRMKSAAEGLGIAVFEGIKEPLSDLAGLAADLMGGFTDWLTPDVSPLTDYINQVAEARQTLEDTLSSSGDAFNDAVSTAATIGDLGSRLMELNDVEDKSLEQRYEMRTIVQELSGYIPELADAYDEETGALKLTNEEIEKYIENKQQALIEDAKAAAQQEIMSDLFEAQRKKLLSDEVVAGAQHEVDALEMEKKSVEGLWDAYEELEKEQSNLLALGKFDEADATTAKMDAISARLEQMGYGMRDTGGAFGELESKIKSANEELKRAQEENEGLSGAVDDAHEQLLTLDKTAEAVADILGTKVKKSYEATKEGRYAFAEVADAAESAIKPLNEYKTGVMDLFDTMSKADVAGQVQETFEVTRSMYAESFKETEELNEAYLALNDTYAKLKEAAEGYATAQKDAERYKGIDEDRYDKAVYDMTRYKAVWTQLGYSISDADTVLSDMTNQLMEAEDAWSASTDKTRQFYEELQKSAPTLGDFVEAAVTAGNVFNKLFPNALDNAANAIVGFFDHAREAVLENQRRMEEIAETSADNIRSAWDQLKESASQTITFSLETQFDGGADLTTETMNENLQSQIDGYKNYVENLEVLRQAVAEGIITPEFFTALEEQGGAAANEIQHMAWTLENQENGVEQVQGISDKWMEALNMQDSIAQIIAGDQAALAQGLSSLGSTDAEFTDLSNAVSTALSGVDTEIESKIQELVTTAQTVGATIPEGLTESIQTGDIDASGIENQLNASIQGALEGLMDVAEEAGGNVPDGLREGIENGTADVQDAYDQLIQSISSATTAPEGMQEAARVAFTTPLATGIQEGQEEIVTAVTEASSAAAEAAQTASEGFTEAGHSAASKYASGITQGTSEAQSAASGMVNSARSSAEGAVGDFSSIGQNMAAGVASGLAAGQSGVINQAVAMVRAAMAAAKAEAQIKSPSKKFAKEVGKQISAGTAFGIKQGIPLTEAEAENLSSATFISATKWLNKYKKSHKVTKKDEAYFWAQMASTAQSGTKAYKTAVNKGLKASIASNFGVSKYTGTGKNKKKKSTETYYSDIYSAAQDYYDMITMNQDMSIQAELAYWQKVQTGLKKGTSAYVSAAQKIKGLKEKIGGFDVASDLLSSFQDYAEMSEKAVMDYWDLIRRNYQEGTEDRINADKKYLDAKKSYYDKLEDLEKDYADAVAEKTKELEDSIKERMETIASAFDMFDAFESESATGEELLFNMRSQAEGYEFWAKQLQQLKSRGVLSEDLMDALTEKGPQDTAAIVALNGLSDEQLKQYNEAYTKKMDLAREQAEKDNAKLAKEIQKEKDELKATYNSGVAAVNTNLNSQMVTLTSSVRSIASDQVDRIIAEMNKGATAQQAVQTAQAASAAASSTPAAAGPATTVEAAALQLSSAMSQQESNLASDSLRKKVEKAIASGTKRSKKLTAAEKKDHAAIWEYIVSNYGYAPNNAVYTALAKALGVSVSSTVTGEQKKQILSAMKAKGLRSGSKRVSGIPVWMDEEGLGSEMVVSRADNAVLTRIPASSAVVPSNLTDNLWQWGRFSPQEFLQVVRRQEAATASYVKGIVASINTTALNNRLVTSSPAVVSGSSGYGLLVTVVDLLSRYLPAIDGNRDTYIDGRRVTSALSDSMSNELAMRARRRRK